VSATLEQTRRLGVLTETVHAVVYFAPEPQERYAALGLRGFWRGYFASRASALGPVDADLVTVLFGGFAPEMVARAIPQVWDVATPADVRTARLEGATAALRRLLAGADLDDDVRIAGDLLGRCIEVLPLAGRPMAAAVAALDRPLDALAALWLDCTVLREHRGDAHLEATAAAGLRWPAPHLLKGELADPRLQEYRGWDDATWQRAAAQVAGRDPEELERRTHELAAPAYDVLSAAEIEELTAALSPVAQRAAAELPYPNAMGVARPA
jgi:hypothetical protein